MFPLAERILRYSQRNLGFTVWYSLSPCFFVYIWGRMTEEEEVVSFAAEYFNGMNISYYRS